MSNNPNFNSRVHLKKSPLLFLEEVSKVELLLMYTAQGWKACSQPSIYNSLTFMNMKSRRQNIP